MKKKQKSIRSIVVGIIVVLLMSISIGFATLTTNLNINGTTNIKKNSWNVHILAVQNINKTGDTIVTTEPSVTSGSTSTASLTYNVALVKPGDSYSFEFTVKNGGTIPVKLSSIPTLSGLSDAQDVYVNHTITNTDGSEITVEDSTIEAGNTKTYKITVLYDSNISNDQLPTDDQNLTLKAVLNYIQA